MIKKNIVGFNVEMLRTKIDEWLDESNKNTLTSLCLKCGHTSSYIHGICNSGRCPVGDLHKICQVVGADFEEITKIVEGTAMETMDDFITAQGIQMVIDDFIKIDGNDEELAAVPIEKKSCPTTLLLKPSVKAMLKELAWQNRMSFNQLMTNIIEDYLSEHPIDGQIEIGD